PDCNFSHWAHDLKMEGIDSPGTPADVPTVSGDALYAVKEITGKGKSIIATSAIPKGTRIICEQPIFKLPSYSPSTIYIAGIVGAELHKLSKDKQRAYFSLPNRYKAKYGVFAGIAQTNSFPLGYDEVTEIGVFLEASCIKHACKANTQEAWNPNIDRLTVHAVKDIEEGEEITRDYLPDVETYPDRQAKLKADFDFDCLCELCSLPPEQRQQSDRRREEITRLDDKLNLIFLTEPMSCFNDVRTALHLLEEEGITDSRVPRFYYYAFQNAILHGDQGRAKIFVDRAYTIQVVCDGEDSPQAEKLRRLVEKPSDHRLYGTSSIWMAGLDSIPQGLSEQEFENWLWRSGED
ncbi:hypothetical protein SLS55_006501, partial [Diplodia seriata]